MNSLQIRTLTPRTVTYQDIYNKSLISDYAYTLNLTQINLPLLGSDMVLISYANQTDIPIPKK